MNHARINDYSFIAPVYDRIFLKPLSEGHQLIGSLMKSVRSPDRTARVLEVGVGSGLTLSYVPPGIDFTGIDVNEKMLSEARKKVAATERRKITLQKMDAVKMEFSADSFDLVVAPSVLSAMDEPMEGLREIIRVTKPGGKIAVVVNLQKKGTWKGQLMKALDPFTRKFLGFRLDLSLEDFLRFEKLRLIRAQEINSFLGQTLSTYVLFEKVLR